MTTLILLFLVGMLEAAKYGDVFICNDVRNLITAFITYVRPMLEYCSPVWSAVSVSIINQLESVQRRFTKRLPGFHSLPYDDRCARLGIDQLELRRLRADLYIFYAIKLFTGLCCYRVINFISIISNGPTHGHAFKLYMSVSCQL